ncbi:hypothetical protein GCM10010168_65530 [Actinoplanes ianthinogenes]|nr:hypothetical protein GCM10010168_65530 [Actinoplanes ianthinogenes]
MTIRIANASSTLPAAAAAAGSRTAPSNRRQAPALSGSVTLSTLGDHLKGRFMAYAKKGSVCF